MFTEEERAKWRDRVARWKNVMYDPATSAESQFRQDLNIGLKPEYRK